jgi:hypothetical protein
MLLEAFDLNTIILIYKLHKARTLVELPLVRFQEDKTKTIILTVCDVDYFFRFRVKDIVDMSAQERGMVAGVVSHMKHRNGQRFFSELAGPPYISVRAFFL